MVTNSKMLNDDALHLIHKAMSFGDKCQELAVFLLSPVQDPPPFF